MKAVIICKLAFSNIILKKSDLREYILKHAIYNIKQFKQISQIYFTKTHKKDWRKDIDNYYMQDLI